MKKINPEYPQFYTATILQWKRLLKPEKYKLQIINSLQYVSKKYKVRIYAFVIMSNHIHIIWQLDYDTNVGDFLRNFMKYTAQMILKDLRVNHKSILGNFRVGSSDRNYQIWERNSLSIELRNDLVFKQKFNYIHNNPVKAGLCELPNEYKFSSARFYETGIDEWGFLVHYQDKI